MRKNVCELCVMSSDGLLLETQSEKEKQSESLKRNGKEARAFSNN